MKKHIGVKVVVMVVTLLIVFAINVGVSQIVSNNSKGAIQDLSDNFLELEAQNAELTAEVVYAKLYMNSMMTYFATQDMGNLATAMENQLGVINRMRDTLDAMDTCVASINYTELTDSFSVYKENLLNMCETVETIIKGAQASGTVSAHTDIIASAYQIVDECEAAFDAAVDNAATKMVEERIDEIESSWRFSLWLAALYVVVSVISIIWINRTVSNPARKASNDLSNIINKIENDEGDLTERIIVKSEDEVGDLVKGVNNFMAQLQEIMQTIQRESRNMNESVKNITNRINESNDSAEDVSSVMEELSASMQEVAASLATLSEGVSEVLDEASKISDQASEGATFVKEIKERAQGIKADTIESKETTNEMIKENRISLEAAIDNSKSVEKINELTEEILSISSQTNLLALNASIEAARAGEAGKGFAVVADEIRQLADSSRETANNIQEISNLVTKAVHELAENAGDMLSFIDERVLGDYDKFVDVAVNYNKDADSMDEMLREFYNGAQALEGTMEKMNQGISGINASVDESSRGIITAAESTNALVDALSEIKTDAGANKEISDLLSGEVDRFKNI